MVWIENVPDATIIDHTAAIVVVTSTAICGSDLSPYRGYAKFGVIGNPVGHEFIGIVEAIGSNVISRKARFSAEAIKTYRVVFDLM